MVRYLRREWSHCFHVLCRWEVWASEDNFLGLRVESLAVATMSGGNGESF